MTDLFAEAVEHQKAGRLDEAIAGYRHLLTGSPGHGAARCALALALLAQQKPDEAADALRDAVLPPGTQNLADICAHIAWAFLGRQRFAEAAAWFERAVAMRPDFAEALYNLGLAQQNQGLLELAAESYRRALAARPELPEPRHNLVMLLQVLGRYDDVLQAYRDGMVVRPQDPDFPRYLVTATYYHPGWSNEMRFAEAELFGARLRLPLGCAVASYSNTRDPERRLRIGYLTSDFSDHPVGRNMELLLTARDRTRFEVAVYAQIQQPDATTTRLQSLVDIWRSTAGLDDAAVADLIRADGVDILVCLAGHFDRNRPVVAAYRPAPIQMSFHDVATSGGDGAFAYLIADRVVVPAKGSEQFTERVLRLPSLYAHAPIEAPVPGPPPCARNGHVTFGSLNNPTKLHGGVLAIWAQILLVVPGARLAFKYRNWFHAGDLKARILVAFAAFGVQADRLEFHGGDESLGGHLRSYDGVDIALDPFPFTGSTATFEALWMGVPVVTLAGSTMMGRWSASMLKALRLDELVAETPGQYVAIARDLAANPEQLATFRAGLRERIGRSPLCNGPLRARQIERLYRAAWRRWCRVDTTSAAVAATFETAQRHHQAGRTGKAAAMYREILNAVPHHAEAFHYLGVLDFQAGRYAQAEDKIGHALTLSPRNPAAHVNLGHVLQRSMRFAEAEAAFSAALTVDPFRAGALVGLGESLRAQGRHAAAVDAARKAVAIQPGNPEACVLLGTALQDSGEISEALIWLRKATALRPNDANVHYNLGVALQASEQHCDAMAAYRQALALDPRIGEAHNNLGLLLLERDDPATAAQHLTIAAELRPPQPEVHNNLGKALQRLGRVDEALACFEKARTLDPTAAEAYVNLGAAQRGLARLDVALASLRRAVELNPRLAEAYVNLGLVLRDLGRLDEARATLEQGLAAHPELAELHVAFGTVLNDLGLHAEAQTASRRAVALKPKSAAVQRNLIAMLVYSDRVPPEERFREHLRFGALVGRPGIVADFPKRDTDPRRRLRVGYISSDLSGHPVGRNLRPIFLHRDRAALEVFVYSTSGAADAATAAFRGHADIWRSAAGLSDRQLADAVRADGIDILVHLAGRFDRNQPGVAAYRPAPVQVSLHDPGTSGISGMDYVIADPVLVPRGGAERFVERVVRLPSFYIHDPLDDAPEIGPLPARDSGVPTFGIFNNPAKLSDHSLALWGKVLLRVSGSRLLFKFRNRYQSEALCRRIRARLGEAGVAEDRLEIIADDLPQQSSLSIYSRVDLALDPLPFTGSTTTFEALWMGVPVITLAGDTMVGRWSASMLAAVGLEQLVARTPDEYVATAVRLCSDLARLADWRRELRSRVAASPLCDGPRRARQIERLYRALWARWCRAEGTGVSWPA